MTQEKSLKGSYINNNELPTIGLFVYDFPHKKSFDFLMTILSEVECKVILFATPKKKLNLGIVKLRSEPSFVEQKNINLESIVKKFHNVEYFKVDHSNHSEIESLIKRYDIKLGIIAGARIISASVIDLFKHGIVNFHPGSLPETAGLDSLYYTIKNNVALGVTAHFINSKVDEGERIFFYETPIKLSDTLEVLEKNNYISQLNSLVLFLNKYIANSIVTEKIVRPKKNSPMEKEEKKKSIILFDTWKAITYLNQYKNKIYSHCKNGNFESLKKMEKLSLFVNQEVCNSWTPLAVASYNQHIEIVKFLINLGANVNYSTAKGTTVLMYAKTHAKIVNNDSEMIRLLIDNGADVYKKDIFGKDVFYYLQKNESFEMISIIERYINKRESINAVY